MTRLFRPRLSDPTTSSLLPLRRAETIDDISFYWLPVYQFPIPPAQVRWILEFHRLLDFELTKDGLHPETFLQFKTLYPELLNRFLETAPDYQPFTGVSLRHGEALPEPITFEKLEAEVKKGGLIDVNQWMMDYCHWFLTKRPLDQRKDFFGLGGICSLWVPKDAGEESSLQIPRIMRTHPLFKTSNVEEKIAGLYSLQDPFLNQLRDVFGEPFRNEPSYPGMLFVLPLFDSRAMLSSTAEERKIWFDIFGSYLIESVRDKGILLAVKDPEFDDRLVAILQQMELDGRTYPKL